MRKYEIMFIASPLIDEAAATKVAKDMEKVLKDNGAKTVTSKPMGLKELAYEIKKHKSGYYFLFNLEAKDSKAIDEFDRLALINENIIRHLIMKVEE